MNDPTNIPELDADDTPTGEWPAIPSGWLPPAPPEAVAALARTVDTATWHAAGTVDVTDRLTDGARALVRERTANMLAEQAAHPPFVAARLDDAVRDALNATLNATPDTPWMDGFWGIVQHAAQVARDREAATLHRAFLAGQAYERGAAIRRRVGKSLASRRVAAQEAATLYLDERTDDAPLLASAVLAGFAGDDFAGMVTR